MSTWSERPRPEWPLLLIGGGNGGHCLSEMVTDPSNALEVNPARRCCDDYGGDRLAVSAAHGGADDVGVAGDLAIVEGVSVAADQRKSLIVKARVDAPQSGDVVGGQVRRHRPSR